MLASFLTAVMGIALGLTFFRRETGIYFLLLFFPFYTLLREVTDGTSLFFIWPYVLLAILMGSILFEAVSKKLTNHSKRIKFYQAAFWILSALFFVSMVFILKMDEPLRSGNAHALISLMSKRNLSLFLFPVLIFFILFLVFYFLSMNSREKTISLLDLAVASLLLFGLAHLFYGIYFKPSMLNAIEGFRLWFSLALVYFPFRYFISTPVQLRNILIGFSVLFVLAAAFSYLEGYLFNCKGLSTRQIPWWNGTLGKYGFEPYTAAAKSFVLKGNYVPSGITYYNHLSGYLMVLGIGLFLPLALASGSKWKGFKKWSLWFSIIFLASGVGYTGKTVLLLFPLTVLLSLLFAKTPPLKALLFFFGYGVLLPLFYAYFGQPCMKYDLLKEVNFTLNFTKKNNAIKNMKKMIETDLTTMGLMKEETPLRPGEFSVGTAKEFGIPPEPMNLGHLWWGKGYGRTDWAMRFNKTELDSSYDVVSRSDTVYLKFFHQFGIIGMALLLGMAFVSLKNTFIIWFLGQEKSTISIAAGYFIAVLVSFIALIHLPNLFKIGVGHFIYILLALIESTWAFFRVNRKLKIL